MSELLFGDKAIKESIPGKASKEARHANLFEITNHAFSSEVLIEAFKKGFEEAFGIIFESSGLTSEEWVEVEHIIENAPSLEHSKTKI